MEGGEVMLKVSRQTREAYIRLFCVERIEPDYVEYVRNGKAGISLDMQTLEAFRRETLDEARDEVLEFGINWAEGTAQNLIAAAAAIEALKEPKP